MADHLALVTEDLNAGITSHLTAAALHCKLVRRQQAPHLITRACMRRAALPRPSVKLDRVELQTGGNDPPGDDFAGCR
jgi:hypothetical protein